MDRPVRQHVVDAPAGRRLALAAVLFAFVGLALMLLASANHRMPPAVVGAMVLLPALALGWAVRTHALDDLLP